MKLHALPQSLNAAVKSICDIMRRSNCAGALQAALRATILPRSQLLVLIAHNPVP
jgi:hypothetical protein